MKQKQQQQQTNQKLIIFQQQKIHYNCCICFIVINTLIFFYIFFSSFKMHCNLYCFEITIKLVILVVIHWKKDKQNDEEEAKRGEK